MRFWLQKGVAGFRIDAVAYLFEKEINEMNFYDEPLRDDTGKVKRIYTKNLDESYDMVYHFHDIVKEKKFSDFPRYVYVKPNSLLSVEHSNKIVNSFGIFVCLFSLFFLSILMSEAYTTLPNMFKYYGMHRNGVITRYGAEIPFIFEMQVQTRLQSTAAEFKEVIEDCLTLMPKGDRIHMNWIVSIK